MKYFKNLRNRYELGMFAMNAGLAIGDGLCASVHLKNLLTKQSDC